MPWQALERLLGMVATLTMAGWLVWLPAYALDPCEASDSRRLVDADRSNPKLSQCDRAYILASCISRFEGTIDNAKHAESYLTLGDEQAGYSRAIKRAREALTHLKEASDDCEKTTQRLTSVQDQTQQIADVLQGQDITTLEAAGRVAVCQAKVDWRRSQIWKQGLADCPCQAAPDAEPAPPEPATDDEEEPPTETDNPGGQG